MGTRGPTAAGFAKGAFSNPRLLLLSLWGRAACGKDLSLTSACKHPSRDWRTARSSQGKD